MVCWMHLMDKHIPLDLVDVQIVLERSVCIRLRLKLGLDGSGCLLLYLLVLIVH